ncbi:MAG: SxtJ family membrane protein [Planctomycetota bacterium]|nr:SxtJ family membrane protein [Planctomycetota bacterium]
MKLVEMNWHPTDRQLRQFGVIGLFALPLLGWLWSGGVLGIGILAAVGLALAAVGLTYPQTLRPIFVGLSLVGLPIGWGVSELTLLVLFYGLFLPIGLLLRLLGRDPLDRKFDAQASSYWQPKKPPTDVASCFRRW